MKTLEIICDVQGTILKLSWDNGIVSIISGTKGMQEAAEKWINFGFTDWIGPNREDVVPVTTTISSPYFLLNLKNYLEKQFDFIYELND